MRLQRKPPHGNTLVRRLFVSSFRPNKRKTKAFRCVSYLDRRIFGTNVKVEVKRWFIINPNAVLVVHTKNVSCTSFVLNNILSVPIQM